VQPLLDIADVVLHYDHMCALKGVSLELTHGETIALIGANGAGSRGPGSACAFS
jgi:branched-chain amino acid transport system ATP-binding protein